MGDWRLAWQALRMLEALPVPLVGSNWRRSAGEFRRLKLLNWVRHLAIVLRCTIDQTQVQRGSIKMLSQEKIGSSFAISLIELARTLYRHVSVSLNLNLLTSILLTSDKKIDLALHMLRCAIFSCY